MKQPRNVSIIINNYNYGRFLADAIDSALGQTYPNVEVAVVDDGSTDESCEVIAEYGGRIIPVLKENGGQASALNAGFAASTGEIVFFLDSDDMLMPDAAGTIVGAWRERVARVFFPLHVIDAEGKPTGRLMGGHPVPSALLGPFGVDSPTSGNAFSREALTEIMPIPDAHWRICADVYLNSAISLFGESRHFTDPLGKYRVHGRNNVEGCLSGLAQLRKGIQSDINLHSDLRLLAPERIGPLQQWVGRFPQHWVERIKSLRESPDDHPWPDTLRSLMRSAISATWWHPYWNFRRKLAYTVFIIGYSIFPGSLRQALSRAESNARARLPKSLLGSLPVHHIGTR